MSFVPKDVIILPQQTREFPDRWLAMNVFAKKSLGISGEVLALLGKLESQPDSEASTKTYLCWEVECFSNEEGLLADPSRFRRNPGEWCELKLNRAALELKLKEHCIVIDDERAYLERFQPKRNLLDFQRFGNFHQQHGQHLRVVKRVDPGKWWMEQKFTEDGTKVREDNLYGAVQWNFLVDYFQQKISRALNALDIGCGTGVYTNLMARCGAKATGVDPSEEYLGVARKHATKNATFLHAEIGSPDGLSVIPSQSVDLIFMSDALLFYFVPMNPDQKADLTLLLTDIHRILKPGGTFISMEPHSTFFLNPWLGSTDRPFTILHEYMQRNFGVVPSLSKLIRSFTRNRFLIRDYQEIGPNASFCEKNPRAYHFAREFPLWQLLEMQFLEP